MLHEDRPRERIFSHGPTRVTTEELVALVLGTGRPGRNAVEVARDLLRESGGVTALARAAPRELVGVSGIGEARAARLCAAFDLGRRAIESTTDRTSGLGSAQDVWLRLRPRLAGLSVELFVVLALDVKNVVIDEIEVARGCLTGVDVHPREVFRPLIRQSAASAVVAHNHPSGDTQPSTEDIVLTRRLREVGEIVGIPILDHVIVTPTGYASIAEVLGAE
jgi:DNA repair protein RadC